jgi:hypothetical protein
MTQQTGKTVAEAELGSGFNTITTCQFNVQLTGIPELEGDYLLKVGDVLRQTMSLEGLKIHIFEIRSS